MRRVAILVAFAALMVAAPGASANPITFPADPGFTAGSAWTASSTCNLLCTATGTQPASGGNPGGQALASFSTVATVLGLATGSVDFTSSAFSWTGDSPASASLHVDTKTSLGPLLSLGGSANATIGLTDVTAAHTTNLKSLTFPASQAWTGTDVAVPSSLLVVGHSYKLTIHTTFSATLALLGGASVGYDNVSLAATRAVPVVSGPVVGTPTTTAVHIGAGVDTAGVDATYHLAYGATTSYGATTADIALAGVTGVQPIGVNLTGLTPLSTYHARLVVTSDGGTGYGPDVSFITPAVQAPPVDPPADPPVDPPMDPPEDPPVDTPTPTTGDDGGATIATTTPTTTTPATPTVALVTATEPVATKAAIVPPACRAVRILARTRGIGVQMENFVTAGAPLMITPRRKAKSIKKVTVDGKAVAVTVKGRKVGLGAMQLKVGRHVIRVGSGAHAAGLGVAITSCRSSLSVRTAAGRSRIALAAVPGTASAVFALPKAYGKVLGSGTLSVRANGKSKSIAINDRTAFSAAAGVKVARAGASVMISGLPANVTDVRLVLKTKRLTARGVWAVVATAKATARLKARAIGTKVR